MRRLALVLAVVALLAGCGGSQASTATAPSDPTALAAATYEGLYGNVAGALVTMADALQGSPPFSQLDAITSPAGVAMGTFIRSMATTQWPIAARPDIRQLEQAATTVQGYLGAAGTQDASTFSAYTDQIIAALSTFETDNDIVAGDLGLAVTTPTT